jgi:hypothetical protein
MAVTTRTKDNIRHRLRVKKEHDPLPDGLLLNAQELVERIKAQQAYIKEEPVKFSGKGQRRLCP